MFKAGAGAAMFDASGQLRGPMLIELHIEAFENWSRHSEAAAGAEHADDAEQRLRIDSDSVRIVAYCGSLQGAVTPSSGCELISTCCGPFEMQTLTLWRAARPPLKASEAIIIRFPPVRTLNPSVRGL